MVLLWSYLEPAIFWENVIFTDEKIFQSCYNGRIRVYRPPRTRFEEKYTQKDRSSGRFLVNFWGWISAQGLGVCHFIEGRFNGETYINILRDIMLPSVMQRFPERNFILQHDNCSNHKSQQVTIWIEENQIKVLPWPSCSPDINIIENVWGGFGKKNIQNKFQTTKCRRVKK